MKKLLVLSLVFVAVLGFDLVICKYRIRTLEDRVVFLEEFNLMKDTLLRNRDSLLDRKDAIIERYDSVFKELIIKR